MISGEAFFSLISVSLKKLICPEILIFYYLQTFATIIGILEFDILQYDIAIIPLFLNGKHLLQVILLYPHETINLGDTVYLGSLILNVNSIDCFHILRTSFKSSKEQLPPASLARLKPSLRDNNYAHSRIPVQII